MNEPIDNRAESSESGSAPWIELGSIIRRHRWTLLASLALGLLVGSGFAAWLKPTYEGSALILVTEKETAVGGLNAAPPVTPARMATEIELLRSSALAQAVVDSLGLQVELTAPEEVSREQVLKILQIDPAARTREYRLSRGGNGVYTVEDVEAERQLGTVRPGEMLKLPQADLLLMREAENYDEVEFNVLSTSRAVRKLLGELEVEQPGDDANLIRVTYRGPDPQTARDVPNVLTAHYMALGETVEKSEARSTAAFLREQLDTLSGQLTRAEDQLRAFRETERVVNPEIESTSLVNQLAELETQRASLEAERAGLARLVAEVRAEGVSESISSRRMIAFPTLLRNEAASELLRSLTEAEAARAEMATRRTPNDRDLQDMDARVAELELQLAQIASTYLQGLTSQVAAMDRTIGQLSGELAQTPGNEVQFARLSRQPRVLQEMHDLLQTRLKEAEIAQAVEDRDVRVIDQADLPMEPVPGQRALVLALFGVLGLVFGIGRVAVKEYTDTTVHSRAELQAATGVRVIGLIPRLEGREKGRWHLRALPASRFLPSGAKRLGNGSNGDGKSGLPVLMREDGRTSPANDAFGRLHTNMRIAGTAREPKCLLFTSPLPGDGKTTTATGYAITLAQLGHRVLLIDADLRRGRVHEVFGVERGPGLSDLLKENPVFEGTLRSIDVGGPRPLRFITSGGIPEHPIRMLKESVLAELLAVAAEEYDRVIIDSPPLMLFPDAAVLSSCADGVVLVARAGATPFDALAEAADQIRHAEKPLVGTVLNGIDFQRDRHYDRSYRWYELDASYGKPVKVTAA